MTYYIVRRGSCYNLPAADWEDAHLKALAWVKPIPDEFDYSCRLSDGDALVEVADSEEFADGDSIPPVKRIRSDTMRFSLHGLGRHGFWESDPGKRQYLTAEDWVNADIERDRPYHKPGDVATYLYDDGRKKKTVRY